MSFKLNIHFIILYFFFGNSLLAQLSPGDLSNYHAHLEGISNCTKCHVLGEKVSNEKCLDCHIEIKQRIEIEKGYHSSIDVKGKECIICHSDHHGRNFQIVHFDKEKFEHSLTGYDLQGAHNKNKCEDCHKNSRIEDEKIKTKEFTFLGLNTECLSCHEDYHQASLPVNCTDCHGYDSFSPAVAFNHDKTRFQLNGKHEQTDCIKCHKKELRQDKQFQNFSNLKFSNCTDCHKDVHNNQFGQNCKQCHTEQSFSIIKGLKNFNHDRTKFKLEGKHQAVDCKTCHRTKYTDPLNHDLCTDCHKDYHENQFNRNDQIPDCSSCHSVQSFSKSNFTIEKHNDGDFVLKGAHIATPCFACHKKDERWSFRNIGKECYDCHTNIHETYIDSKYYPDSTCMSCHTVNRWSEINFDHSKTDFKLEGAHVKQTCRSCHFVKISEVIEQQQFKSLNTNCMTCHNDIHFKQFEENELTNCNNCHGFNNWTASKFDHKSAAFKLEGEHKNVACVECHKKIVDDKISYIQYKFNDYRCITCHK